jgi:L-alanine-DL-glutamate epimerase-like enolase superfamily enzyme
MRVIGASVLEFRRTLDGKSWNPSFRWTERRAPLLLLHAENGQTGLGEAWSRQNAVEPVLAHLAQTVAPQLVGRDLDVPARRPESFASMAFVGVEPWVGAAAASAVDVASWDLRAKAMRLPLWQTLTGTTAPGRGVAHVYASGGLYRDGATVEDLAREITSYVANGFTGVKMKIGALSLDDDLARVRAVRDAVGPKVELWVDAVNQLAAQDALAWCRALAGLGVRAIQAPVAFDDVAGMARINRYGLPVIAAETEFRPARFEALLQAGAVGWLQFCLGLCGGFSGAMRLDAMAAARHVPSSPQCFSTAVLQAASLHFAAASGNAPIVEYHRFHDHLSALLPPALRTVVAGRVLIDDAPGLGLGPIAPGPQPCGGEIVLHARIGRMH